MRSLLIHIFLASAFACASAHSQDAPKNPPELATLSPLQFLDFLKEDWRRQRKIHKDGAPIYSIAHPVQGWIREEHIPALLELLDSKDRCTAVVDVHSSFWPSSSTVGDEAAFMIASFRAGKYPHRLIAGEWDDAEKAELRNWWEERQRSRRSGGAVIETSRGFSRRGDRQSTAAQSPSR